MIEVARLYATVSYFHPAWDDRYGAGFATALEQGRSEALQGVLAALYEQDRVTALVTAAPETRDGQLYQATTSAGFPLLVLSQPALLTTAANQELLGRFFGRTARAPGALIDLRADAPASIAAGERLVALTEGIAQPAVWQRAHYGKTPEGEGSSGGFHTGWIAREAAIGMATWPPTAFLVTAHTALPPFAMALVQAGRGALFLVGEGELDLRWCTPTTTLPLPEGRSVRLCTGIVAPLPFTRVADLAAAQTAAAAWLEKPVPAPHSPLALPERAAAGVPATRLEAALRLWSALWLLHPDRERLAPLLERAWPSFLNRVRTATTPSAFQRAVRQLLVVTGDGHAVTRSPWEGALFGTTPALVRVQQVEGHWAITRLTHPAAERAGLRVGDVIESVDGTPVAQRIAALNPWLAASTPQARRNYLANRLLLGPEGQAATLTVVGSAGPRRRVVCPRFRPATPRLPERGGDAIRPLGKGVVYADLDRLAPQDIEGLFARYGSARALILDLRGYADEVAWALAAVLAPPGSRIAARYARPVAIAPVRGELHDHAFVEHFTQPLPPRGSQPRYGGKVACLVDERTQSQAELTALFLVACGATLIGSPTAGTVGDVTSVVLTDGILARFSGQDVRFPDGRRIARAGIPPTVPVSPTLAGLRAGRDEVLEVAQRWLK